MFYFLWMCCCLMLYLPRLGMAILFQHEMNIGCLVNANGNPICKYFPKHSYAKICRDVYNEAPLMYIYSMRCALGTSNFNGV